MKHLKKLLGALVVATALAVLADEVICGSCPPLPANYCDKQALWDEWGWYWSTVYIMRGCGWPS